VKDKLDKKKFKKLEKEEIWLQSEIPRLKNQQKKLKKQNQQRTLLTENAIR